MEEDGLCLQQSNLNRLLPTLGNNGNSILLGFAESTIGKAGRAREEMNQQFKFLIGNDQDKNFRKNDWTRMCQLRFSFLRILVAMTSHWYSSHTFMFESNSKSVVAWIADPTSTPWQFQFSIRKCCNVFGFVIVWL